MNITISGTARAKALATALIDRSAWFICTPLPDGRYLFDFKVEHHAFIRAWFDDMKGSPK